MKTKTAKGSVEAVDLYQDETMAMVYVGDVYSLVVQSGSLRDGTSASSNRDDDDTVLPFIR
jgi:hypothetical protein